MFKNADPFYFSEIHKEYEIRYLKENRYNFIKDLSYTENNCKSRILLFEYEDKNILRGYKDGIIFPKINYFDIENIHIKKIEKKLQQIFDYINNIFTKYKIVDTKIYLEPYLCHKLGYNLFDMIDVKDFNKKYEMHIWINFKEIHINNIEKYMKSGGTRTIINGYKKNKFNINIYYGEIEEEVINNFKNKHTELAGRQTKSDKCWNIIKKMIIEKEAILVCQNNNFVLFHFSQRYSYYGINACTRKDKIVTILLYEGIKWLKENNCNYIHFGIYKKFANSEKSRNISKFKQSFCNKIYNQYYLIK